MSKDPAVLFYTSDFIAGTQFFSDEQCGQYIRLLCQQHQLGHIPNEHMLNICKTYDSPVWQKFVKDANGGWYNERMELEKEKRIKYCASRRSNKMKEYEHEHMSEHMSEQVSRHMDNGNENENVIENTTLLKSINKIVKKSNMTNVLNNKFEEVWNKYPKKLGRKEAERHFNATVLTDQDFVNIHVALENYLKTKEVLGGFIKHGSTWFNQWKDYINYVEPKTQKELDDECTRRLFRQ
jgi:uncharacterized protein YdaU (DUF1376 family)